MTGLGASLVLTPIRMKYIDSVTTTGESLRYTVRTPLRAPMQALAAMVIRTLATGGRPAGESHATNRMFAKTMLGPIDMSMPPRPLMIAGAFAMATIASGASCANCSPIRNPGCKAMFRTSRTTARISAKR